jgi:predicted permease
VWRHWFGRRREERDAADELDAHVELLVEEKVAKGMAEAAARREASIELGGMEQVREAIRDVRPGRRLEQLLHDVRYAARGLARNPTFTLAAVVTLALGIGANTAIFSVLDAVLIRPLPYDDPSRLAVLWTDFRSSGQARVPASGHEMREIERRSRLLSGVAGIWVGGGAITGDGEPEQVRVGQVTGNFLSVLGARPGHGRLLRPTDEGPSASPVVVISDGLWRRRFGADPALVGKALRLNGRFTTVVGIMPAGFEVAYARDASVPRDIDVFRPFGDDVARRPRDLGFLRMIGRLRPGTTIDGVQAELDSIAASLRQEFREYATPGLALTIAPLQSDAVRDARPILLALFGAVGMVTLIACANVANLLLARATRREREIAVRAALGATRGRIARQLLTESVLVALIGGVAGLGVGWIALRTLLALRPAGLSRIESAGLSPSVLAFTFGVTALAGILSGLAPVGATLRRGMERGLRERGAAVASPHGQRALVLVEVALGFVLLAGAGLMLRTFVGLLRADPGFRADRVLTFQVGVGGGGRYPDDASAQRLFRSLLERVRAIPGVEAAGAVSHLPLDDYPNWYEYYWREGAPAAEQNVVMADHRAILPGYFDSAGVRILEGRDVSFDDEPGRPNVIVVDESLARRTWPGASALGKRLAVTFIHEGSFDPTTAEVVGVVRHVRDHSLSEDGRGQVYVPYMQSAREKLAFTVRASGDPEALVGAVREAVASLDRDLAVAKIRTMSSYVASARESTRFATAIALALSGVALLLAFVGIYGVVACSVAARTGEIGVRMALGGSRPRILWLVVGQTLKTTGAGLALGLAASLALTGLIARMLYGVGPRDPATLAASAAVLAAAGLLAGLVPALRAMRIDPTIALRQDA